MAGPPAREVQRGDRLNLRSRRIPDRNVGARGRHMTIVLAGDAVPARRSPSGCAAASIARLHGRVGGVNDSEEGDP